MINMNLKWSVSLPYILIFLNVAWIAIVYDQIPDTLNAHYKLSGQVDRLETKSILTVFAPNLIQLMVVTLIISFRLGFSRLSRTSNSVIQAQINKRNEISHQLSLQILNGAALMVTLVFFFVQLGMIGVISPQYSAVFALGLVLIFIITTIIRTARLSRKIKSLSSDDHTERYWKAGTFYYNSDDSSLFVEKRYGLGWTINFAKPLAWLIILLILLMIALVVVFG